MFIKLFLALITSKLTSLIRQSVCDDWNLGNCLPLSGRMSAASNITVQIELLVSIAAAVEARKKVERRIFPFHSKIRRAVGRRQ